MINNSYDDKLTIVITQEKWLEKKTKIPFMWKCSLLMNGHDHIFQNGVPIYGDRITLFLIGGVAMLGLGIPTIT
jgi:hypothetical protein